MSNIAEKTISENRRARFDYEIGDKYEAGIELRGFEVKSAKAGRMQIAGSYAIVRNNEAWLLNSQIPPYQPNNTPKDYEPGRTRRLLLRAEEIKTLAGHLHNKKNSLIPLSAYVKKGFVKIEIGLCKPRKKSDKREVLKKRAHEREMGLGE